jgi:rhodanese-related sulfurtransferase
MAIARWSVQAALMLALLAGCTAAGGGGEAVTLDAAAAAELVADREDVTLVDVRTPQEYAAGHIKGAELIDVQAVDFRRRVEQLDPDGTYVVYCRSGSRSATAAAIMVEVGLTDVSNAGGYDDLAAAGLETEKS